MLSVWRAKDFLSYLIWANKHLASLRAVHVPFEWRGRPAFQKGATDQGVALAPSNRGTNLGMFWQGQGRSVCVCREHAVSTVFYDHRQQRARGGCAVTCMPQNSTLRISTSETDAPPLDRMILVAPRWPAKT